MTSLLEREAQASAQAALELSLAKEQPYWVAIYERDAPQRRFDARLGDTPPTPGTSGGGSATGDFEVLTLPKRASVVVWRGRLDLILMSISIVIGDMNGTPLHPAGNALEAMYRPPHATQQPPVVKIRSVGTAVPYQHLDYVVAGRAWGDMQGGPGGNRLIQKMTVSLLEYRADEVLQQAKAAKPKHRGKSYVVKSGDSLSQIAKRFGVKGGWKALGDAQHPPIRDPRKIRVGQRLLVP